MARFAAFLFDQAHGVDAHASINGLAHVVDRKQTGSYRGITHLKTTSISYKKFNEPFSVVENTA